MDDLKHPNTKTAGQIDVSSVKHCLQHGDAKLALQYCYELLACNPKHVQMLAFAAVASRSLGWLDDALGFINRALVVSPNQPAIHSLMGDILLLKNKPEQALSVLFRAQELGVSSAQIHFNIGSAYLALFGYEDAKIYFDNALAIEPQLVAANVNKGLAEHSLMNLNKALDCFDAALKIDPKNNDALWNKSHILLTLGHYEEGFRLYEARWAHQRVELKKRKFDSALWLGEEDLQGKTILLHAEGGFGDTLQFIRYAKLFADSVELIVQCQLPLIELIKCAIPKARVITSGEAPPPHEFHCPLMSLPLAFETTIETVPTFDQYIFAEPDKLETWRRVLDPVKVPIIGIMVEGSNSFTGDKRSIHLTELIQFLPQSANYILLHKELSQVEADFIHRKKNWLAPEPSFSEAAAICDLVDYVISVDTSMAHLSAAMGKPTAILLPFRPDWRWGASGNKTPWYKAAKLFRQNSHGSWTSALNNLISWHTDCLKNKLSQRS